MKIQSDVLKLIRENVKNHEETIDQNEPRDFTDKVQLSVSQLEERLRSETTFDIYRPLPK